MRSKLSLSSGKGHEKYDGIVLLLVLISCLSKLLGFARDIVLTNAYGASSVADAYIAMLSIPDMVLEVVANAAMVGFIPLAMAKLKQSREDLNSFASSIFKILLIVAIVFVAIVLLFPQGIIQLLVPGFQGESLTLSIRFLRVMCFSLVFRSVTSVFQAYLGTVKYFVPNAFVGVVLDCSIIACIIVSKRFEWIDFLPWGVVLGTLLQMLLLLPFAWKKGMRPRFKAPVFSEDVRKLLAMSIPAVLSVCLMHFSSLYNKALASGFGAGGITMLNVASRMSFFVENIIVSSVIAVLYPLLSEYFLNKEENLAKDAMAGSIQKIIVFLLPATVGLALLSEPIIKTLYGHGEFDAQSVKITAELMIYHVIGILGIAVQTILTRALFAMKRIKTSVAMSLSLLCVYVGCSYVFSRFLGLRGIAVATGISYTVGGFAYYLLVWRICHGIRLRKTGVVFLKAGVATLAMAMAVLLVKQAGIFSGFMLLAFAVGAAMIVYFGVATIMNLEYVSLRRFFNKLIKK